MQIRAGDMFKALLRQSEADAEPIELHRIEIVSVDGDCVVYRRVGGDSGEMTVAILQAAIDRGDVVKVGE